MKRLLLAVLIAGALITSSAVFAAQIKGGAPRLEKAAVEFTETVKLLDVLLKGEYIFVHDDDKMAKGEDCTYVYTSDRGRQGKLVTSFHCEPIEREKSDRFTVIVEWNAAVNLPELVEYRFAGSTEGHKVPRHVEKP